MSNMLTLRENCDTKEEIKALYCTTFEDICSQISLELH